VRVKNNQNSMTIVVTFDINLKVLTKEWLLM